MEFMVGVKKRYRTDHCKFLELQDSQKLNYFCYLKIDQIFTDTKEKNADY